MTDAADPTALTPIEAALAGLLHDIGKLAQRAHPNEEAINRLYGEAGRDLAGTESAILPLREHGRYSHRHALWTDFFFVETEVDHLHWPEGVNGNRVKAVAVRHHNPRHDDPGDWIIAEADRLASGLERKQRDEQQEAETENDAKARTFREVELLAVVPRLDIGVGKPPDRHYRHQAEAKSAETILPREARPADQPRAMGQLWDARRVGYRGIAQHRLSPWRFEQALLGLSERLLWAVPSSTVDQPDVSLHDHARAVAAIAACLAAWHRGPGRWDVAAIKDRGAEKFRLVVLDLSGIQHALFRLADQKGAARLLRARSFLMAETVSAALVALLRRLDLPVSCVLLNAGGKAEILAPALPDLDAQLAAFRAELDTWMVREWQGDLALIVAAGPAFAAKEFAHRGKGLPAVRAALAAELEDAKQRPLSFWTSAAGFAGSGIIEAPFGADGACASCGVRPAVVITPLDGAQRCRVCDAAYRLGQRLPGSDGFALVETRPGTEETAGEGSAVDALPPPWRLLPWADPGPQALVSVVFEEPGIAPGSRLPSPRAYVPRLSEGELADPRYAGLEGETPAAGDLKTFAHIAADALEPRSTGSGFEGRALLAVLKADVDRLGLIFSAGLGEDRSPARIAALSRMMDAYFGRRLPWLLQREFPSTYTVYAGGDDLLLVLPWRFGLPLALRLREDFGAFAGGNPNLSLSAGIAFVHPHHPIARAVEEADEALDMAKAKGRDRVGLFGRAFAWDQAEAMLELAEDLTGLLRAGAIPPTFLYRVLSLIRDRADAEASGYAAGHRADERKGDAPTRMARALNAARWPARWAYARARFAERQRDPEKRDRALALLDRLLPPPTVPNPPGTTVAADVAEPAVTFALWRVR